MLFIYSFSYVFTHLFFVGGGCALFAGGFNRDKGNTVHFGVPCVEIQPLHVTPDLQATTRLCRKDIEKVKEVD